MIVWAISFANPSLPKSLTTTYAKVLQEEAHKRHFDPFTGVAIIYNESRWRAGVISPDGEDFGLSQQRARYFKGCSRDMPAAQDNSPSCQAVKAKLLNGVYSIRRLGSAITAWRKTCRKVTKRPALFRRWLHGYGGMGKLSKTGAPIVLCGHKRVKGRWVELPLRKELRRIIQYRRKLIRKLEAKRRSRRRR